MLCGTPRHKLQAFHRPPVRQSYKSSQGILGPSWMTWSTGAAFCWACSRLKAFEKELGVQPPLGFWDPMGFTDDGDLAAYRRRRSVELKHGRIAMLATMGLMTPEIIGHWPGYLSPSLNIQFADVPNGLAALNVVPSLGWSQILIYFGLIEYSAGFEDYRTGTPGDYGWKVLTSDDPVEKRRKLNAELANGRLAMVAVMALLFQNGVAGTTGPEMWIPNA